MYSMHNVGNLLILKDLLEIWTTKLYKYMTSILKNVYIDKFEDIDNTYKNTYHKAIQMKPLAVNPSMYVDFNEENNSENRNLMLEIMLEYQNIKTLSQKAMFRIRVPKFL